jgi:transposase
MRVTTAFNRILALPGASVASVTFGQEGVVVGLRRRRAKHRCPCGWRSWAFYDRSVRRWRHLDLGAGRCFVEAQVCRIECRRCARVRTEEVPWARPGARHTRAFQDVVAWLAQRTDKTTITKLLRVSWEAVAKIVVDVVAEQLDDTRLEGLVRIGVDELAYKPGLNFLTVVADHDRSGAVVWAAVGKKQGVLEAFYDELGPERVARLEAVSMDMARWYKAATDAKAPHVTQCVDPFHVVKLANDAIKKTRMSAWYAERAKVPPRRHVMGRPPKDAPKPPANQAPFIRSTRWALIKDPDALNEGQLAVLDELRRTRSVLYRCWQLKEGIRDLYRLADPADAAEHLDWWLAWACRSRIPSFVTLSKTVRKERGRILAAIELGLSNSKLEGLNSKIRLINHRGYGHHSAAAIIAMIYLCCGGITVDLPTARS